MQTSHTEQQICNVKLYKLRSHSVQEIVAYDNVEIRVITCIKTDIKTKHDRLSLFVLDKKNNKLRL